jgi:hypothetical protein
MEICRREMDLLGRHAFIFGAFIDADDVPVATTQGRISDSEVVVAGSSVVGPSR